LYYLFDGDLLMNRLATSRQVQAVSSLVEGNSINATCRMTGIAKHTVLKLLKDLGCAAAAYCRVHKTLRVTPAMETGLTDHVWDLEELLCALGV
jgi:hypothetical protein